MTINITRRSSSYAHIQENNQQSTMLTLWKSLVTKILSKNLEGIELRQNINYWKKLKYLNFYSLEGGY